MSTEVSDTVPAFASSLVAVTISAWMDFSCKALHLMNGDAEPSRVSCRIESTH